MNGIDDGLSPAERDRFEALRSARSLADLVPLTDAGSEHDAYFAAKREWRALREKLLPAAERSDDHLPGDPVAVDGRRFVVHGVTHADTDAERDHLRGHVAEFLEAGAAVYCEQGARSMYFSDVPAVCDGDHRWALERCRERGDTEPRRSTGRWRTSRRSPAGSARRPTR